MNNGIEVIKSTTETEKDPRDVVVFQKMEIDRLRQVCDTYASICADYQREIRALHRDLENRG